MVVRDGVHHTMRFAVLLRDSVYGSHTVFLLKETKPYKSQDLPLWIIIVSLVISSSDNWIE